MTTPWHMLPVGTVVHSPEIRITDDLVEQLVRIGGYVHPLFTDPNYAERRGPLPARPLPGTALLHLMGGLAEQCGVLDETVLVLLGFDRVRFVSPALHGDVLRLELEIGESAPRGRPGQEELVLEWRAVRNDQSVVAEARALMLVRRP